MTGESPHEPNRRRILLATFGVAAGVSFAGCSGDEGGSGGEESGDDNDDEDDPDTTLKDLCGRIPGEFVGYDVGAVPTICDFDIPAALEGNPSSGDLPGNNGWGIKSGATRPGRIGVSVGNNFEETVVSDEPRGFPSQPAVTDIEFNGETVTLFGQPESARVSDEKHELYSLDGELPYTIGNTKLYFPVSIGSSVEAGTDESIPEDCRASVREVGRRVGESLRVNEETTVEAHLEDRWENPP